MTRVLYVGGGREIDETLEKARSLGIEVLYVQRKEKFRPAQLDQVAQAIIVDYRDPDVLVPLARTLRQVYEFQSAISMSEDALEPVARVVDELGLRGNSRKTVALLKNKALMRARLNSAELSVVAARQVSTVEEVIEFGSRHGYPLIAKPLDESGSFGVSIVEGPLEVERVISRLRHLGFANVLIEEYLDGPEISVETFTFDGRHVLLGVTREFFTGTQPIGVLVPAGVDEAAQSATVKLVYAVLDLVGLRQGPAHTEVKLTTRGPRIVESHNRPGGGRISELLRHSYGVDVKQLTFAWACGLLPALTEPPELRCASAVRFLTPEPGVVTNILGLDEVRAEPDCREVDVRVGRGDVVPEVTGFHDVSGHVLACGPSIEQAMTRCENLARTVRITTVPAESFATAASCASETDDR